MQSHVKSLINAPVALISNNTHLESTTSRAPLIGSTQMRPCSHTCQTAAAVHKRGPRHGSPIQKDARCWLIRLDSEGDVNEEVRSGAGGSRRAASSRMMSIVGSWGLCHPTHSPVTPPHSLGTRCIYLFLDGLCQPCPTKSGVRSSSCRCVTRLGHTCPPSPATGSSMGLANKSHLHPLVI